jgi:hypothetical protein
MFCGRRLLDIDLYNEFVSQMQQYVQSSFESNGYCIIGIYKVIHTNKLDNEK